MTGSNTPAAHRAAHRTVDLVYFNAGGGHRASALALEAAIRRAGLPWTVRLVNLREVLDPNDGFRKLTGMDPEDVYNRRLARGWTLGLTHELKVLQAVIRWAKPKLVGEVAFTEWTDEGSIRHPSFQGLREDKKAEEVVREEPA